MVGVDSWEKDAEFYEVSLLHRYGWGIEALLLVFFSFPSFAFLVLRIKPKGLAKTKPMLSYTPSPDDFLFLLQLAPHLPTKVCFSFLLDSLLMKLFIHLNYKIA